MTQYEIKFFYLIYMATRSPNALLALNVSANHILTSFNLSTVSYLYTEKVFMVGLVKNPVKLHKDQSFTFR